MRPACGDLGDVVLALEADALVMELRVALLEADVDALDRRVAAIERRAPLGEVVPVKRERHEYRVAVHHRPDGRRDLRTYRTYQVLTYALRFARHQAERDDVVAVEFQRREVGPWRADDGPVTW